MTISDKAPVQVPTLDRRMKRIAIELSNLRTRGGYLSLDPEEAAALHAALSTKGGAVVSILSDALDLADSLIERAYGTETPKEWDRAYKKCAKARSERP